MDRGGCAATLRTGSSITSQPIRPLFQTLKYGKIVSAGYSLGEAFVRKEKHFGILSAKKSSRLRLFACLSL